MAPPGPWVGPSPLGLPQLCKNLLHPKTPPWLLVPLLDSHPRIKSCLVHLPALEHPSLTPFFPPATDHWLSTSMTPSQVCIALPCPGECLNLDPAPKLLLQKSSMLPSGLCPRGPISPHPSKHLLVSAPKGPWPRGSERWHSE